MLRQRIAQGITAVGVIAATLYVYGVALFHPTWDEPVLTRTVLDDYVPYVPASVWVYLSPYIFAPLLFAFLPRAVFVDLLRRVGVLIPLQFGAFFVVTTTVARPPPPTGDDATSTVLRTLYTLDSPPLNAAPSAHVTLALLIAYGAWRGFPRFRVAIAAYSVAIAMSVVMTGQHHVLDVILAIALVSVVFALFHAVQRARA